MLTGLVFSIILLGLDLEYRTPRHAHDLDARIAMLPLDARERLAEASHLSETERMEWFYQECVRYKAIFKYLFQLILSFGVLIIYNFFKTVSTIAQIIRK